jgi:hypothetical protein
MGRRFGQIRAHRAFCGLKIDYFCPEFEQFKHVLFPELTDFENREPLLKRVFERPMVELLNIHAKLLTIEAKKCSTFAQITIELVIWLNVRRELSVDDLCVEH